MSVLYSSDTGFLISHDQFINHCYSKIFENSEEVVYKMKKELFKIVTPYSVSNPLFKAKKRKLPNDSIKPCEILQEDITHIRNSYKIFRNEIAGRLSIGGDDQTNQLKNIEAANLAEDVYKETGKHQIADICGGNGAEQIVTDVQGNKLLFPSNCKFYCKDINDINQYLSDKKYNFIVLDPPWWNKFVRRKKKRTEHGYKMMYSNDLKNIPVEDLLLDSGLVAIWCTNSQQHMDVLLNEVFSKWNVKYLAKLFWLKITTSGETVCPFAPPNGKQPFEQIVLACRNPENYEKLKAVDRKIIVSVPSALHSHKPPLEELLKPYLAEDPISLEIFARYLLPNWTSYGLEVLKFQHLSLYDRINKNSDPVQS